MGQRLGGGGVGGGVIAPKRLGTGPSPTKPGNLAQRLSAGNMRNRVQFTGGRRASLPGRQAPRVFTNSRLGMNRQRAASGGGGRIGRGGGGGGGFRRMPGNKQNFINKNANQNGMAQNQQPIKKNLDMDLDEYMSKSKSHLDADLNTYMAKSKTHLDADLDTYMAQAPQ